MKKRLIITEKNIPRFLKAAAKEFPFELKRITSVKEVTKYTNASFVYRASCLTSQGRKVLYLKQSDEFVKRNREISVEPERVVIENEKIKVLEIILGKNLVPHVLYVDYQNYVLVMEDIQGKKKILIEEFAKDKVYPQLAEKFGNFFGTLHGKTYNTLPVFNDTAWQKRIYSLWTGWLMFGAKKHISKDIINKFINQSEKSTKALIWGDPVNRNIFVDRSSFSVLDFDFAMHHDPALDNGIFLAQWVIKSLEGKEKATKDCRYFVRYFVRSYIKTMKSLGVPEKEVRGIIKRTVVWTGAYMVSRTDGKSGSYYKKWPKWENKIREIGIALVTGKKNVTADWFRRILTK
ncbi:MAG: phosphotransferase [Candidatus Marinimicrobia bacterium]|jgi:5-methylthioribose kinase|nr:phosphotransferase [Candidatus Neomarinimicrobiota bacterium]